MYQRYHSKTARKKMKKRYKQTNRVKKPSIKTYNTSKQADYSLQEYKHQLEMLAKAPNMATANETDLEMYTINHRIIHLLLLKLIVINTIESIKIAKDFSKKNGINLDSIIKENKLNSITDSLPTIKSTVNKTRKSGKKPTLGSISSGWVWDY